MRLEQRLDRMHSRQMALHILRDTERRAPFVAWPIGSSSSRDPEGPRSEVARRKASPLPDLSRRQSSRVAAPGPRVPDGDRCSSPRVRPGCGRARFVEPGSRIHPVDTETAVRRRRSQGTRLPAVQWVLFRGDCSEPDRKHAELPRRLTLARSTRRHQRQSFPGLW